MNTCKMLFSTAGSTDTEFYLTIYYLFDFMGSDVSCHTTLLLKTDSTVQLSGADPNTKFAFGPSGPAGRSLSLFL